VWFAERNSGKVAVVAPNINFVMSTAPPDQLNAGSGFGFAVTARYDSGAIDTGFNGSVTASLSNGPTGGTNWPVTAMAVGGIATFSGLSLSEAGSYTLQVSSADAATSLAVPLNVVSPQNQAPTGNPQGNASAPSITGERLLFAGTGKQKRLVGIQLTFSAALDPSSAANAANYSATQNMKRRRAKVAQAVRLRVSYNDSAKTVTLMVTGKPKFTYGGQLAVNAAAPSGIIGASGIYLDGKVNGQSGDNAVFAILPGGRGLVG
jgi:hypothetical protein